MRLVGLMRLLPLACVVSIALSSCKNSGSVSDFVAGSIDTGVGSGSGSGSGSNTGPVDSSQLALPKLRFSPSALNFGSVAVGSNATLAATVTNVGTAAAANVEVEFNGHDSLGDFTHSCPSELAVAATCTLTVTFTPISQMSVSGFVSVNFGDGDSVLLPMTGVGLQGSQLITVSPALVDFGGVDLGDSSAAQTVTITNSGDTATSIDSVSVSGSSAFVRTHNCPAILAPSASCSADVTFAPTVAQTLSASLVVTYNTSVQSAALMIGYGVSQVPSVELNPTAFDFGTRSLNTAGAPATVYVINSGQVAVDVTSVALNGSAYFSRTHNCTTIPVNGQCTVSVSFLTPQAGTFSTLLNVSYAGGSKQMSIIGSGGSYLSFAGISTIDNVGASSVRLNWTAASGGSVSSYKVYRYVNDVATLVATLANSNTQYTVTGLSPSTTYQFRVDAEDSFGASVGSTASATSVQTAYVEFDAIAAISVVEGSAAVRSLSCASGSGASPVFSIVSQSDPASGCVVSGSTLTCTTAIKEDTHSSWQSTIDLNCNIDGSNIPKSVVLTATDLNRAPVLSAPASRLFPDPISQGLSYNFSPSAGDPDDDTLSFSCLVESEGLSPSDPSYLGLTACTNLPAYQGTTASFSTSTGVLSWTPHSTQIGTFKFTITVDDGYGASDTEVFRATVAPYYDSNGIRMLLHPYFADQGQAAGSLTNQISSWHDIGPFVSPAQLLGFSSNGWAGSGSHLDPYRMTFQGGSSRLKLSYDPRSIGSSSMLIYFRLPASAADGHHVVYSHEGRFFISVRKGAGQNQLFWWNESAESALTTVANSFTYDQWWVLHVYFTSSNNYAAGAWPVHFGTFYQLATAWQGASQTSGGNTDTSTYVGYKPDFMGPNDSNNAWWGDVDIREGTERSSSIEVKYVLNSNGSSGAPWNGRDNIQNAISFFDDERTPSAKLGDIRRTGLRHWLDAANSDHTYYRPTTTCTSTPYMFPGSGVGAYSLSLAGISNPTCTAESGRMGVGSGANPYRFTFDGGDDYYHTFGTWVAPGSRMFTHSNREHTLEMWINPSSSSNTSLSGAGFGHGIFSLYNNWSGFQTTTHFSVFVENPSLGSVTSNLQFRYGNPSTAEFYDNLGIDGVLTNNQWNHIVLTSTASGRVTAYVNGEQVWQSNDGALSFIPFGFSNAANQQSLDTMLVGRASLYGPSISFGGSIAIMRGYINALTADEILAHCNQEKVRFSGATCGP